MRVLVAMSGGVDSSVAAALLAEEGHDVVGVTMKLWGGPSDTGCCSVADVHDARRVADRLGIDHHTWNLSDVFTDTVVTPYVEAHRQGLTPNPCVACNRHLKFDALLRRAEALGFDAVATGHHARRVARADGSWRVARGADAAKDQSYVLYMLGQAALARTLLPIGGLTKAEVRALAVRCGLRTASKPDSQDVCFIPSLSGRARFLGERIPLREGRVVDEDGRRLGSVAAVELVTIGQRRGLGTGGVGDARYAIDVDPAEATVTVATRDRLDAQTVPLTDLCWADGAAEGPLLAQSSAHGEPKPAVLDGSTVVWETPQRRVAPGQVVALYQGDQVVGGGIAARG